MSFVYIRFSDKADKVSHIAIRVTVSRLAAHLDSISTSIFIGVF